MISGREPILFQDGMQGSGEQVWDFAGQAKRPAQGSRGDASEAVLHLRRYHPSLEVLTVALRSQGWNTLGTVLGSDGSGPGRAHNHLRRGGYVFLNSR